MFTQALRVFHIETRKADVATFRFVPHGNLGKVLWPVFHFDLDAAPSLTSTRPKGQQAVQKAENLIGRIGHRVELDAFSIQRPFDHASHSQVESAEIGDILDPVNVLTFFPDLFGDRPDAGMTRAAVDLDDALVNEFIEIRKEEVCEDEGAEHDGREPEEDNDTSDYEASLCGITFGVGGPSGGDGEGTSAPFTLDQSQGV
jgi:hypothetical protein